MPTRAGAFHLLPSQSTNTTRIQLKSTLQSVVAFRCPDFMLLLSTGEEVMYFQRMHHLLSSCYRLP